MGKVKIVLLFQKLFSIAYVALLLCNVYVSREKNAIVLKWHEDSHVITGRVPGTTGQALLNKRVPTVNFKSNCALDVVEKNVFLVFQ